MPLRFLIFGLLALTLSERGAAEGVMPVLRPEMNALWSHFHQAGCTYTLANAFVISLEQGVWLDAEAAAEALPELAEWLDTPNTRACRFAVDPERSAQVLGLEWPARQGLMVLVLDSPELGESRMFDALVAGEDAARQAERLQVLMTRVAALEGVHGYRVAPSPGPR